jgi:uncharacterized MAPEG superfamily protein
MMLFGLSVPSILLIAIALAASVVVYFPFTVVAYGRVQIGYNKEVMAAPRAAFDKLPNYAKRATWAHQNSWEAFSIFSVAALMAYVTQQDSLLAAGAAIVWVIARLLFSAFYIANIPVLRSMMFGVGSICSFLLIGLSIIGSINMNGIH